MKELENVNICKRCFYDIACVSATALSLYLDICYRHLEGSVTFFVDDCDFEDLNYLEREGFVISADSEKKDCIRVVPRVRETKTAIKYCRKLRH